MFDIENRLEARDVQVRSDNSPPASTETSPGIVFGLKAAAIGIAGGLLTGVAMVAALETGLSEPASYALQVIPVNEVDTAAQSLIAAKAVDLVSDAKACRQPLAYLLVRAIGAPSGAVRIRSGSYVSPNLKLETQVERIAIPFPAPYQVGSGQIVIENTGNADVFLTPGFRSESAGSSTLRVHWNSKAPC